MNRNIVKEVIARRDLAPCWTARTGWTETPATPRTAAGNRKDIFDPRTNQWLWIRAEHCTHPNQEHCDCDWCRLRSSFVERGQS